MTTSERRETSCPHVLPTRVALLLAWSVVTSVPAFAAPPAAPALALQVVTSVAQAAGAADDQRIVLPGRTDAVVRPEDAQVPPRPISGITLLLATLAMIAIAAAGLGLTWRSLREDRERRHRGHRHRSHREASGSATR
jgi:hypothetical protein